MIDLQDIQKRIARGDVDSVYNLGQIYLWGLAKQPIDYKRAYNCFLQASNKNHAKAQNNLAYCYEFGLGVEKNIKLAKKYYKQSSEGGCLTAKCNLLHLYQNDSKNVQGVDFLKEYTTLSEQGNLRAKYKIGKILDEDTEEEKIEKYLKESASGGYLPAQKELLDLYDKRFSFDGDDKLKHELAKQLAEKDYAKAYYVLGNDYFNGNVVKKDYKKAFEYFEKGALLGDGRCASRVGYAYYYGKDIEKDYYKAFKFLKIGADLGNISCSAMLGMLYQKGLGVEKDYLKSYYYCSYAENQGDDLGSFGLGVCYQMGYGVEIDYEKAFDYFDAAYDCYEGSFKIGWLYQNGFYLEKNEIKAQNNYESAFNGGLRDTFELGVYLSFCVQTIKINRTINFMQKLLNHAMEVNYKETETFKALCYLYGMFLKEDLQLGKDCLKVCADSGLFYASLFLGRFLVKGEYFDKDESLGLKYLEQACKSDEIGIAYYEYANCLYNGVGTPVDKEKAFENYLKSAKLSYAKSFKIVGKAYYLGDGCVVDKEEALRWYLCGAKASDLEALHNLGCALIEGKLIEQDKKDGINSLLLACKKDYKPSAESLLKYMQDNMIELIDYQLKIAQDLLNRK